VPSASPSPLSGSLAFAAILAAVAGFVDAHGFVNVAPVFVANMSGNLVLLGIAAGEGAWGVVARHGTAIAAFVVGVAVANLVHERRRRGGRELRPDLLFVVEAVLLLAVTGWLARFGGDGGNLVVEPVVVGGALAMGLQTAALLRVGSVAVATTYESGAVARVGEGLGRSVGSPDAAARRHTVAVLAVVLAGYVAGAALAAWAGAAPAWLLLPVGVLVVSAADLHRRVRSARVPGPTAAGSERR
jgi:uncharacterized membrane protein YoaK (UPF0700 family)